MDDNQDKPDYFQFRWGVKEWDVGFTTVPNPVLKYYSRVAWVDKDGKEGRGISNQEMLCIIHIASFHYESEQGEARPAIGTVARRMGYRKDDSVRGLIKSLEHKNLLVVERPPGKCNIYSLMNFSRAILEMDSQPPHPSGDHSNGGLSDGGHSNGPHSQGDEEKKVLEERKQEGKEEKEKKEGFSAFPEKERTDENRNADHPHGRDSRSDGLGDGVVQPVVPDSAADALPDRRGDGAGAGTTDPVVEAIADDFLNNRSPEDLQRATLAKRKAAGGNYAAPPTAGGDDGLAAFGLFCLYDKRDKQPPRQGTKEHSQQCEKVREALRVYGYSQCQPDIVEKAAALFCERKGEWVNVFYRSFIADFGVALQDAEYFIKHGRLPDDGNRQASLRRDPARFDEATRLTMERLGHHGDG